MQVGARSAVALRCASAVCCSCLLLVQGAGGGPRLQLSEATSWGIGLVVPEGSALSGGTVVDWGDTANLTAVVQLPDLTNVSAPTFAVVSLMIQGGTVLQVAFGILPRQSEWLVYAMYIPDAGDVREQYVTVANSSGPSAWGDDYVALSIYQEPGGPWWFTALDENTSTRSAAPFGAGAGASPDRGDQETFALESYASESGMFRGMGNMTLTSLLVNGGRVESGWYPFIDWDIGRNPLFVVGGGTPVAFVDVALLSDGRAVWYYSGSWGGGGWGEAPAVMALAAAATLLVVASAVLAIRAKRRSTPRPGGLASRNRLKYALSGFRRAWR